MNEVDEETLSNISDCFAVKASTEILGLNGNFPTGRRRRVSPQEQWRLQLTKDLVDAITLLRETRWKTGRSAEAVTVKRLVDTFNQKTTNYVGISTYHKPYKFSEFEKHLSREIVKAQSRTPRPVPTVSRQTFARTRRNFSFNSGSANTAASLQLASPSLDNETFILPRLEIRHGEMKKCVRRVVLPNNSRNSAIWPLM